MQLTLFDILVLVVIGLSALAAMMRGAVREVLALVSWVGAAVAAFLLHATWRPGWSDRWWRAMRWPVAWRRRRVFVVVLIALKLLSGMVAGSIDGQRLGTLDKLLGLVFGAARGVLVVCVAYLVGSLLIKPELQPAWVRDAYLIAPIQEGANRIARSAAGGLSAGPDSCSPRPTSSWQRAIPTRSGRRSTSWCRRNLEVRATVIDPDPGMPLDDDKPKEECGIFAVFGQPTTPPRTRRSACTPCSIAARRRRASSASTASTSTAIARSG